MVDRINTWSSLYDIGKSSRYMRDDVGEEVSAKRGSACFKKLSLGGFHSINMRISRRCFC